MRRILSLLLALCIIFSAMTSLTSCLPPIDDGTPPASGDGGVDGGGENNGNQDEDGTGDQGGEGGSEGGSDTGAPAVGIGYNGYVEVEALGGRVYFTGETANTDYYLATSLDVANAATLYLEAATGVDGGYRLYFMKGDVKTYIRCYERTAGEAGKGKGSIELVTTSPAEYYTYDETYKTLVVTSPDGLNKYFVGTYYSSTQGKVFDTLSGANYSYITAENVGLTQFPMCFAAVDAGTTPDDPGAGGNMGGNTPDNPGAGGNTGGTTPDNPGAGGTGGVDTACQHTDTDKNDYCDSCSEYLIVVIDIYALNDLHGKFCDTSAQPGVDELGTYFENRKNIDDHVILLSSGDMWQGAAESVLTEGRIMVEWMNELGFVGMTVGNHEFDWGEEPIRANAALADFPFLAINIYNKSTNQLADYCTPSVIVECGGAKVGIIGAIGDCYSSISSDMVSDVYFKVGSELTALVKAESERLRALGVDLIVLSMHDGLENSGAAFNHYDSSLSSGYVDLVFEAHSHQSYVRTDSAGIVHLQAGGENYGLSHVEIQVHLVTGVATVNEKEVVTNSAYAGLDDHLPTEAIEDKYSEIIDFAYTVLGTASRKYSDTEIEDMVAELYLEAGIAKWGERYDVVLGGGFLKTRSPYSLSSGQVTYSDILSLLPFNNKLTLCKISGKNLLDKFINSSSSDYHVALKSGFTAANVNTGGVYYVIVDTYTALYKYNNLTIVEYYDDTTYARDLLADAVSEGRLGSGSIVKPDGQYDITPISSALAKGETLKEGESTTEELYYKGTVKSVVQTKYGNCYIVDEHGDEIFVYGLYDTSGNLYENMDNPPKAGDVIIICATIKRYVNNNTNEDIIELINAVVVAVNPD